MASQSIVILVSPFEDDARSVREALAGEGVSTLRWCRRWRLPPRRRGRGAVRAVVADLDLLRQARGVSGIGRSRPIPLIVIPRAFSLKDMLLCLKRGVTDYVQRPIQAEDFILTLKLSKDLVAGFGGRPERPRARLLGQDAIEVEIASSLEEVTRLGRLFFLLADSRLPEKIRMDVRLGVDEICHNAVEWGNRFDPRKTVSVACAFGNDRVRIAVKDMGSGFDPRAALAGDIDPIGLAEIRRGQGKRQGGLGLKLVRSIVDEMTFNSRGNMVTLVKRVPRDG